MKINIKKRNNFKILSLISITVFIALLTALYFASTSSNTFFRADSDSSLDNGESANNQSNKIDLYPATDEQKQEGERIKNNSVNSSNTSENKGSVTIKITATNQNENNLQIRTLIDAITNTGTCTLTLADQTKVITKEAQVQATANSSTCAGFDIPLSELHPGTWQVSLAFNNDGLRGAASAQVNIE